MGKVGRRKLKPLPKKVKALDQKKNEVSFTIKPIIIRQQYQPVSKSHIKELLTWLHHRNSDVMHLRACSGLIHLLRVSSINDLIVHIGDIIKDSSKLLLSRERKVRKRAIELLTEVMSQCIEQHIRPHFNFLSVHFRCAMRNINKQIAIDCCPLLNAILKWPQLIRENDKLFAFLQTLTHASNMTEALTKHVALRKQLEGLSSQQQDESKNDRRFTTKCIAAFAAQTFYMGVDRCKDMHEFGTIDLSRDYLSMPKS